MPESNAKRSAIVEQLLRKASPQYEPEADDATETFQEGRLRSHQSSMLDFRLVDGTIESFAYAYLTRVRFVPGDRIDMRFGRDEIRVKGRNLSRLCETITEQRTRFIQEGSEGEEGIKPSEAAHVDEIVIIDGEEL